MPKFIKIAKAVKLATKYDLKAYCEIKGLNLNSLYRGFISQKAMKILKADGVNINLVAIKDKRSKNRVGGIKFGQILHTKSARG